MKKLKNDTNNYSIRINQMRTFLLIQALIFFLIALKLLKYSDEKEDIRGNKRYSQGLDLKTTISKITQNL